MAKNDPAHKYAKKQGWELIGSNSAGHRVYEWKGADGMLHTVTLASGVHSLSTDHTVNVYRIRQSINRCISGKCRHVLYHERRLARDLVLSKRPVTA